MTTIIIPAASGTALLSIVGDEPGDEPALISSPVLAWSIGAEAIPVPITARGAADGIAGGDYAIEFLSGPVISPTLGTWQSRADFLLAMGLPPHVDGRQLALDLPLAA